MAAAAKESGNSGIFWMNGVSDDERPLVFVPGLEGEGKSRFPSSLGSSSTNNITSSKSCTKTKKSGKKQGHTQSGHSGVYTKEQVSVHHNTTAATQHTLSPALGGFLPSTQVISETSRTKSQVCLKDLCPEDKRRIANLIEELARVSEEKEESVQRLKDEQENFECKIQKLEQQNVVIIQERESLQQQYRECQELLGLYQQYLSQQQAKLNQSIAQLSQAPAHSKVLSSEEAPSRTSPSRASGSPTDGSYLGLAAARAQQPQVHRSGGGGRGTTTAFSSHASLSRASEFSPTHGPIKQHRVQKRECRHSESHHRCQDSGSRVENGHHDTLTQYQCERLYSRNAIGSEANEALTRPLLGHEDWEEKRHHLLLQKMQLETERERLQARLAEQEERLNRQNRELHQSRLEYSRLAKSAQSDMSSSNARNGALQQESLSQQHAPSSVRDDAEVNPAGQCLHEKPPQTVSAPQGNGKEALQRSKKDMATSPVKSPASLSKPTSVPVMPKTPEDRLDFSVVELLDVFSPISAPELSKRSTRRPKVSQQRLAAPKPVGRTLFTPGSYLQSTQQDLEESQILEDIFFIC